MRGNTKDTTIWRNYIGKYHFLIRQYEQVKRKEHSVFKLANKVVELRKKGNSRLEIASILKPALHKFTPSASGVYNICKRYGLNRLTPKMQNNKRKIIKERRT